MNWIDNVFEDIVVYLIKWNNIENSHRIFQHANTIDLIKANYNKANYPGKIPSARL